MQFARPLLNLKTSVCENGTLISILWTVPAIVCSAHLQILGFPIANAY